MRTSLIGICTVTVWLCGCSSDSPEPDPSVPQVAEALPEVRYYLLSEA